MFLAFAIGFLSAVAVVSFARDRPHGDARERTVAPLHGMMERDRDIHERIKDHCVMGYVDVNGNIVLPKWKEMP